MTRGPCAPGRSLRFARSLALFGLSLPIVLLLLSSCGDDPTQPDGDTAPFEWRSAPPEEHHFAPELLDTLTTKIDDGDLGFNAGVRAPHLQSAMGELRVGETMPECELRLGLAGGHECVTV